MRATPGAGGAGLVDGGTPASTQPAVPGDTRVQQQQAAIATALQSQAELFTVKMGEQLNAFKIDQSVNNWDKWSVRLQGPLLCGLCAWVVYLSHRRALQRIAWLDAMRTALDGLLQRSAT